jgi:histidinol phosphatase-like PHP family hydrolase
MTSLYELCDFHVHTHLSPCARPEMRLRAIGSACAERGIKYLGLSDHIGAATDTSILATARREAQGVRGAVRVFVGCEAETLGPGRHTITEQMKRDLDFVCVAANHFHLSTVDQPADMSPKSIAEHFVSMFGYACSLEFVDFVAHPMFVYPRTFDPTFLETIDDDALVGPLREAKKNNIAMEISPRSLDREQLYFRMRFLRLCKEVGLKFAIGSDAHRLEMVGSTRALAPIIRELDLKDDDIWLPRGADQ